MKVADRITVIRDGRTVDTLDTKTAKVSEDRIIKAMVGRELTDRYPPRHAKVLNPDLRGEELERLPSAPCRAADDQERELPRLQGRGRRHRGADGCGPHRTLPCRSSAAPMARRSPARSCCMASPSTSARSPRPWMRACLCHGRPQDLWPGADRPHQAQCDAGQPRWRCREGRGRRRGRAERCQQVSQGPGDPLFQRLPDDRQPLGRQPAEGVSGQVAVLRSGSADPR